MENLIDSIYGIIEIYEDEYSRRKDYFELCRRVKTLKENIMKKYPTKTRATYETYMLFEELKRTFHNQIKVFKFKEFQDIYKFETKTYRLIDTVYRN